MTDGAIVAGGRDVRAYDLADGSDVWSFEEAVGLLHPILATDETVYVREGPLHGAITAVMGLDAATGELAWRFQPGPALGRTAAGPAGLYVCPGTGTVYALE